jgi:hypothetical protein
MLEWIHHEATKLTHSLILQLNVLLQSVDRLFISTARPLEEVQWTVMLVHVAMLLLEDLSLVLPPCPQARALIMGQLMMQLNIVSALIVSTWHFWNAKIVAHFMSLAFIAPGS